MITFVPMPNSVPATEPAEEAASTAFAGLPPTSIGRPTPARYAATPKRPATSARCSGRLLWSGDGCRAALFGAACDELIEDA
jgi:hypothetical protein